MFYVIYIAFFVASIINLCFLAWGQRAQGLASLATLIAICLHYEALHRLSTGYSIVFDLATRSYVYSACNTYLYLYWAGAILKYCFVIRSAIQKLRHRARLYSLLGKSDL